MAQTPKERALNALKKDMLMVSSIQRTMYSDAEYAELLSQVTGRKFSLGDVERIREDLMGLFNKDLIDYLGVLGFGFRLKNFEVDAGYEKQNETHVNMGKRGKSPKVLRRNIEDLASVAERGPEAVRLMTSGAADVWVYPDAQAKKEFADVAYRLLERQLEERLQLRESMMEHKA